MPDETVPINLRVSCADTAVADNASAIIMENNVVSGEAGDIPLYWDKGVTDDDGTGPDYGHIKNLASQTTVFLVMANIPGASEGNTTCTVKIGEPGDWQTVDIEVGYQALVDPVFVIFTLI